MKKEFSITPKNLSLNTSNSSFRTHRSSANPGPKESPAGKIKINHPRNDRMKKSVIINNGELEKGLFSDTSSPFS